MSVKKAIIPAAGLGTRFLPATKATPKEMLPIVDKPTIQYIVEEAVASGIEDIIIISGRGKRAIEDHFDKSFELEKTLLERGKIDRYQQSKHISDLANIHYIRQKEPLGLGHAIQCAETFIGDDPFAVLLGDDIVRSKEKPCLQQMIEVYEKTGSSIIGTQRVPYKDVPKYGILVPEETGSHLNNEYFNIMDLVEKPAIEEAPSNYAIMGRYILDAHIFDILADLPPGSGNEIQLTDAIKRLNHTKNVAGYEFDGKRYDVGDKFGFIKATVDFSLEREDLQQDVRTYLEQIMDEEKVAAI